MAGFIGGVASTLVVHPLDVLKTRLQVDRTSTTPFGTSLRLARGIIQNEGLSKGFYRGLSPNIVGNSVSWALYFFWYSRIKLVLGHYHASNNGLSYYDYLLASGTAGALTAICTNPIWVIKTRMLSSASYSPGAYRSITHVPSLLGVSHGALQFMAYEQLKQNRAGQLGIEEASLGAVDLLCLSGASKVFAGSTTYPYQVVRARLQTYQANQTYKGAIDAVAQIWKQEGLRGFYRGLGPNLVRVLPSTWVTFLAYEKTKTFLPGILKVNSWKS
ncbi:MAG: hypothetical protein L6R41_004053 [Letrouitia leprolyta]|nr:MAG: hypothetical protein L6R41_004053 [Letrouitia leprolyta]